MTLVSHLLWQSYRVYTDPFHNVMRLDLDRFDGSPMNPMYLVYQPPEMLPTTTLHPPAQASATGKAKRVAVDDDAMERLNMSALPMLVSLITADRLWWIGVIMTFFGGLVLILP
jgi:Chaperone for protein-folding within the ER, fungal